MPNPQWRLQRAKTDLDVHEFCCLLVQLLQRVTTMSGD
jgi:hypothetical protein